MIYFFSGVSSTLFLQNVLITTIHTGKIGKNIIFYCKHFVTSFILTPESLKINVFRVFLAAPTYSDVKHRARNDSVGRQGSRKRFLNLVYLRSQCHRRRRSQMDQVTSLTKTFAVKLLQHPFPDVKQ